MKHIVTIWFMCLWVASGQGQILVVLDARTHEPVEGVTLINNNVKTVHITDREGKVDISEFERAGKYCWII